MDAEGRRAVEQAKKKVLGQLQQNAKIFAGQLRDHLNHAKQQAEEEQRQLSQAHKKRKADQAAQEVPATTPAALTPADTPAAPATATPTDKHLEEEEKNAA
eukprot:5932067-Pyramimonas_sp.AAC.1